MQQHGLVQRVAEWVQRDWKGRRALRRWTAQWWLWQHWSLEWQQWWWQWWQRQRRRRREGPVSMAGGAGCVIGSAVHMWGWEAECR